MTAKEQEALFAELTKTHPHWTPRFTSGYVAGVVAEGLRKKPEPILINKAHDIDPYALGYLMAFAIHRGSDVEEETWFSFVSLLVEEHHNEHKNQLHNPPNF